ncbi:transglycosylase SLT domain-containing protein [Nocardia sp. NEAU-G5]|uniref:Transglycosylase SLT domain-containing protein n=1 Tax=Nocardia albiluteola TaxID=2842303 RepID=A0ABS6B962_9NOCA|nr:transglycosylase SLT domain-containing protein [Nocardia albiluteola]MBU3066846.1 transglycosylase SLT domain-containing protein [Nocardia albiluteola]
MGSTGSTATVEDFPVPAGIHQHTADLITTAHTQIQDSVDLLGAGEPQQAPDFIASLRSGNLEKVKDGSAMAVSQYQTSAAKLKSVEQQLKKQNAEVGHTTFKAGTIPGDTWETIQKRVDKLVATLKGTPAPAAGHEYVSAGVESSVQDAVLTAVVDVSGYIESAYAQMVALAATVSGPGVRPATVDRQTYRPVGTTPWNGRRYAGSPAPAVRPSGDVKQWIEEAKKILIAAGVRPDQIDENAIATIIENESGGDPNAINNWDSNAAAGHPSKGLMQCIDSTFNSYAVPGHTDIWNPVDNIVAATRYSIATYGGLDNVPGVKAVAGGGSYVGY